MFQCQNCGGGLKFNIESQKLKCDNCGFAVDPYSLDANKPGASAEENTYYDVTIYTCPHCGGELLGTEDSAIESCSFCGAQTILNSRLSRVKRPDYIIPFKITKEGCKKAYKTYVGHSFFAPKAFKNPKYIDSFRGIYMPYWTYYIEQKGSGTLPGKRTKHIEKKTIVNYYNLNFTLNNYYKGLSFDASSSFYDNISSDISPFNVKGMKRFHPGILSGFYADAADIPSTTYADDAKNYCNNATLKKLSETFEFNDITIMPPDSFLQRSAAFHTHIKQVDSAMFPVWFMSYRHGKRVAHAVVNGQTGKTTADFPVSVGKYILCSLLIALPIFLLLASLFSLTAKITLLLAGAHALMSSVIYAVEISNITKKDAFSEDRGVMRKNNKTSTKRLKARKIKQRTDGFGIAGKIINGLLCCLIWVESVFMIFMRDRFEVSPYTYPFILGVFLFGSIVTAIAGTHTARSLKVKAHAPGFICSIAALAASFAVTFADPDSVIYYYAAMLFSLIMVVILNLGIIYKYNILATKKLPQLNKKGERTDE